MSTFNELVDRAVFLSAEHQWHFAELIKESSSWNVDFQHPVLRFETADPLRLRPHFIGSLSSRDSSWHWAWDNINGFPASVIDVAEQLGRRGAEVDVAELTRPEIPVAEGSDLPFRLALAAKTLTGIYAHYPADAGGGTQAWLLVQSDRLALPDPSIQRIAMLVAQSLKATEISDHRAALGSYVRMRGVAARSTPGGGLRIIAVDGAAQVTFDAQNRITEFAQSSLDPADRQLLETTAPVPIPPVRVEVAELPEPPAAPAPAPAAPASAPSSAPAPAAAAPAAEAPVAAPAAPAPAAAAPAAEAPVAAPAAPAPAAAAPAAEAPVAAPAAPAPAAAARSATPAAAPAAAEAPAEPAASSDAEDVPTHAESPEGEDKPRKGLFSRLFGR